MWLKWQIFTKSGSTTQFSIALYSPQNWQPSMQLTNKIRAGYQVWNVRLPELKEDCQILCFFLGGRRCKLKGVNTLEGMLQHVQYYCTPKHVIDTSGLSVGFRSHHVEYICFFKKPSIFTVSCSSGLIDIVSSIQWTTALFSRRSRQSSSLRL